jgi:hypothetical protein
MDERRTQPSPSSPSHGTRNARRWLTAAAVLIGLLLLAAWQTKPDTTQPIPFPHVDMVERGVQCLFCHTTATKSPAAGMPSVEKCMGCHKVIASGSADIQALAGFYERGEPIPWKRIYQLPRFVYFSHRVHVSAGFNCERCHGDVGNMTVTEPAIKMSMGWCIDCHKQQPEGRALTDCITCHQ